ncbi:MAG: formate dehydrogenase accessory sulfurtransferase FdhD [Deltaproteobacteria bacterium]|nr:formate dehydrogenase accessory sulfurtransferase FdhD [Deltaproteobacteria bacterium]
MKTTRIPIVQISDKKRENIEDTIVREFHLKIFLNEKELTTLVCSPSNLNYLVTGFLLSEGLIREKKDLKFNIQDENRGIVWVKSEEKSTPVIKKVKSTFTIKSEELFNLMQEFDNYSLIYKKTGGVHSSTLCSKEKIILFAEDIGRHNTIDRILGECLIKHIPADDCAIITSARILSSMLKKIALRNIPLISSVSAPTDLAIELAKKLNITIVGFARKKKMNVYSNNWRVT